MPGYPYLALPSSPRNSQLRRLGHSIQTTHHSPLTSCYSNVSARPPHFSAILYPAGLLSLTFHHRPLFFAEIRPPSRDVH
jgi:hypothetical protein